MTKPIEQEFYEAFGIKPTYFYYVTHLYYNDACHNFTCYKNGIIKYFSKDKSKRYKVTKVCREDTPITDHILLELEDVAAKIVWFLGDSLLYEVDKKANKATDFRYRYYAREYSDRLLVEAENKKEALLKLLCNSYLKDKIYNDVRKIMGVEDNEIPF